MWQRQCGCSQLQLVQLTPFNETWHDKNFCPRHWPRLHELPPGPTAALQQLAVPARFDAEAVGNAIFELAVEHIAVGLPRKAARTNWTAVSTVSFVRAFAGVDDRLAPMHMPARAFGWRGSKFGEHNKNKQRD